MNPHWNQAFFDDSVKPAAAGAYALVRQYGWDRADCEQKAAELLAAGTLAGLAAKPAAYTRVAVRRMILRAARPATAKVNAERAWVDRMLTRAASPDAGCDCGLVDLCDLIASAPGDAKTWLHLRVECGATWDEVCQVTGWTRARAADVARAAQEWLVEQLGGLGL